MKYEVSLKGANEILLNHVLPQSTVLEFGPADGTMTRYMHEKLQCTVYIVEKDEESFKAAIQYAEDGVCGDILSFQWMEKFRNIKFDFIIFPNVLEHLGNPGLVIKNASKVLDENGTLLVAIPNIAHNDIILNLYQNKFVYTEEGLLDITHVHFWGYHDLKRFFAENGYTIIQNEFASVPTLYTEQNKNGNAHLYALYELLKQRPLGEVYQFILTLKKIESSANADYKAENEMEAYAKIYIDLGDGFNEENTLMLPLNTGKNTRYSLDHVIKLPGKVRNLRLDPTEGSYCLVQELEVTSNIGALNNLDSNAYVFNDIYYFTNTDSQILIKELNESHQWIRIKATIIPIVTDDSQELMLRLIRQLEETKKLERNIPCIEEARERNISIQKELEKIDLKLEDIKLPVEQGNDERRKWRESNSRVLSEMAKRQDKAYRNLQSEQRRTAQGFTKKLEQIIQAEETYSKELLDVIDDRINEKNELQLKYSALEDGYTKTQNHLAHVENELRQRAEYAVYLENYIEVLKSSTCWKITKPVRMLGDLRSPRNAKDKYGEKTVEEKQYKWFLERKELLGNSLIISGWIASKYEIKGEITLGFESDDKKNLGDKVQIKTSSREDVRANFGDDYKYAVGFYLDAYAEIPTPVDVTLTFQDTNGINKIKITKLTEINSQSSFKCMVLSEKRGYTALSNLWNLYKADSDKDENKRFADIPVDIIVPIYNGYSYFEALFGALDRVTHPHRLILINDCSPDPKVKVYLKQYADNHKNVVLIENSQNLGFVQTVNKGLRIAQNHVILLNTDIVLPDDWVERLMLPIFKDERTATTTPFTNSGTICSFPYFCQDNEIFEKKTVDVIDNEFAGLHPQNTIMPTGVGFCMGMNIKAIRDVGYLDEENFSKGYGEENDWCQRAIEKGYYNVHVNNLFVYHKHGGSFLSDEKKRLLERNSKILAQKHPKYNADVAMYCALDPMRECRETALGKIILNDIEAQTVLAFNHNLGGGANSYLEKRKQTLLNQGNKFLLVEYHVIEDKYVIELCYKKYKIVFESNTYTDIEKFILTTAIDEIWINELVSYKNVYEILESLIRIKKQKKIELIMLLHDLFFVCPAINMLDSDGKFCGIASARKCEKCAAENPYNHYANYSQMKKYRAKWGEFLHECSKIIAFSTNTEEIFKQVYGDVQTLTVIPHTVSFLPSIAKESKTTTTFNIGLLGVLNKHKGLDIIREMLELIEKNKLDIRIILIGSCDELQNNEHFFKTGKYTTEELPRLVSMLDIDVFFISSIWPETFSYTTAEIMELHYPLASFDIGAPAERIKKYDKGMIIDKISGRRALEQLVCWRRTMEALPMASRRILFVVEERTFASRYRVEHVREQLSYQGIPSDEVSLEQLDSVILSSYTRIVVYRVSEYKKVLELKLRAHGLGIDVVYDIDDFIFDYEQIKYLPFLHKEEYWDFKTYCSDIQKAMCQCDSFIVSTETLKRAFDTIPKLRNKPVYVKRNMASMEMFCLSLKAFNDRKQCDRNDDICMGYFSGSKTHDGDFNVISDIVYNMMEEYQNLHLKVGGCLELSSEFDKFGDRITRFPFKDWRELPAEIASVDINLMPLEDTFFNQCKSENKWMEAALVHVPTIASYNSELASVIINKEDGYLCKNEDEWRQALKCLIEDSSQRAYIADNAYIKVKKNYLTDVLDQGVYAFYNKKDL